MPMGATADDFGPPSTFDLQVGGGVVTTYTYTWTTGIFHLSARPSVLPLTVAGTKILQDAILGWLEYVRGLTSFVYGPVIHKIIHDQTDSSVRYRLNFGPTEAIDVTFDVVSSLCTYQPRVALSLSASQFKAYIDAHVAFSAKVKDFVGD